MFEGDSLIDWVDRLSENDFVVIDDFLTEPLFEKLRAFFLSKLVQEDFAIAGVGTLSNHQIAPDIRKDFIYWINREEDTVTKEVFLLIDKLIQVLREYCFLSISDSEFHLAHYPKGAYYHRHIDQFKDRGNRLISVIVYLNENWDKGDGGELKVYTNDKTHIIEPIGKRLVLFKSNAVPHEVMKTNVSRYSLTGWLLNKPANVGCFVV